MQKVPENMRVVSARKGGGADSLVLEQRAVPQPGAGQVEPWHEGDWYDGPTVETVDATCSTGDAPECGFDVALRTTWGGRPLDLHGGVHLFRAGLTAQPGAVAPCGGEGRGARALTVKTGPMARSEGGRLV